MGESGSGVPPLRLEHPNYGQDAHATYERFIQHIAPMLSDRSRVIGIGSPRASLEANFALRTLVGSDRFYSGMSDREHELSQVILDILINGSVSAASLCETEISDAVLVLGEDIVNVAPVTGLALRQSVRQKPMRDAEAMHVPEWNDGAIRIVTQDWKGPFFVASPFATRLDDVATALYRGGPDDIVRLALAVAHAISDEASEVPNLRAKDAALVETIASTLLAMRRPLIVSGMSCSSAAVLRAAATVAWALRKKGAPAKLSLQVPECNTLGAAMIGGGKLSDAFRAVAEGRADTVVVLENDLYRRADAGEVDAFLAKCRNVIVLDNLENDTVAKANFVAPTGTFAESDGTLVNNEGRAQRFYQVFVPQECEVQESWRWLRDMMMACDRPEAKEWQSLDDLDRAITEELPKFAGITVVAPLAEFRIAGEKIARQPARYSGRTAMTANISMFEPKPPNDPDSALAFSMEGFQGVPPAPLTPRFWAPGWNSVQAVTRFQEEVNGPLRGGPLGVRLIEPMKEVSPELAMKIPAPFTPQEGKYLVLPRFHIFGSEELSILSPGIAERAPTAYIGMNAEDLAALGVEEGAEVELKFESRKNVILLSLPVKAVKDLVQGVVVIPVGLTSLKFVELPQWARLRRFPRDE